MKPGRSPLPIRSPRGSIIPSIGPEHAWLKDRAGREYVSATDAEAWKPASAGADGRNYSGAGIGARRRGGDQARAKMKKSEIMIVNVSGRGDKDIGNSAREPHVG